MSATLCARLRHWWNKSSRAGKPIHRASLNLETLEMRTVPSNMPAGFAPAPDNQVFLATVYQGELQRPIESVGLTFWSNQLNQNVSREISIDFNSLLGRDPDPSGLLYFTQALQSGATPQDVQARIMGSDEFFA